MFRCKHSHELSGFYGKMIFTDILELETFSPVRAILQLGYTGCAQREPSGCGEDLVSRSTALRRRIFGNPRFETKPISCLRNLVESDEIMLNHIPVIPMNINGWVMLKPMNSASHDRTARQLRPARHAGALYRLETGTAGGGEVSGGSRVSAMGPGGSPGGFQLGKWGYPFIAGWFQGPSHRLKWMMTGGTPMTKRKPPYVSILSHGHS